MLRESNVPHQVKRVEPKNKPFKIEKLEQRIAPKAHFNSNDKFVGAGNNTAAKN